jgi:hypothetical protein
VESRIAVIRSNPSRTATCIKPRGFEWNSFKSQADEALGDTQWTAIFQGEIWNDNSLAPEKNATITIDIHLEGGTPPRRIPSTHVSVHSEERQPFMLGLLRGQEWRQFKTCMDGLFREIGWSASFEGSSWFDQSRVPPRIRKFKSTFIWMEVEKWKRFKFSR